MDSYRMNRSGCGCQGNMNRSGHMNDRYSQNRSNNQRTAANCPACIGITPKPVDQMPLAMGYIPLQHFEQTYDLYTALRLGTVFPELCKPFCGKGGGGCR